MALDITPEQREVGQRNFAEVTGELTRRGFMKSLVAATAGVVPVSAAVYFGYQSLHGKPVKTALIGAGDEGGVLVGEHNPEYLEFVAVCDIRPTNLKRIFAGEGPKSLRKGFDRVYGSRSRGIKKYTDYRQMLLENKDVEAVVIALPLFLHAPVAVEVMRLGKERGKPIHVLCEKLMAWNINQCKKMIQVAHETNSILAVGHQRHYSLLYAHATEVMRSGVLGDVKHIRALWHRNNSWPYQADPKLAVAAATTQPFYRDGWFNPVPQEDYDALEKTVDKYGYGSVEELVRWRLFNATGGGLMAELGSHQLDACSIFLGKVHPLAVSGVGTKSLYGKGHNDRDVDDHVFVTYEFPGKNYASDKNDVVVVTYSSVSTNQFEAYGECVMGSRGTMVVEAEQRLMLFPERDPNGKVPGSPRSLAATVSSASKDKPALEASASWGPATNAASPAGSGQAESSEPVSRGYREEMEDFAYCVRLWDQGMESDRRLPRCHGKVAMADAIIALTANLAMKSRQRLEFKDTWFDAESGDVPDGDSKPRVPVA